MDLFNYHLLHRDYATSVIEPGDLIIYSSLVLLYQMPSELLLNAQNSGK